MKYKNGSGFGVHEVYYDGLGLPWAMTTKPTDFCVEGDEGAKALQLSLVQALSDVFHYDVLDEPEVWPGIDPADMIDDMTSGHDAQHDDKQIEGDDAQ